MTLDELSIVDFKNIVGTTITLAEGFNCFSGVNGAGKSNTLDAIHFLSTCRSITGSGDSALIRHDSGFFMVEGRFKKEMVGYKISCGCKRGSGKSLKVNDKEYPKISSHIGEFPVVLVSPLDSVIITDSAEERRRYVNMLLSQIDREYLQALIAYNGVVKERNMLLKNGADGALLDVLDMQLGRYGELISQKRALFCKELEPIAAEYYKLTSGGRESLSLEYRGHIDEDGSLERRLLDNRSRDIALGYTSVGPHRDDIQMSLDGFSARKYGSQGQQKSFIVALKLAQSQLIVKHKGIKPLLLLDDIFDKLDYSRVENLISLVSQSDFGQIFISDSNKVRLDKLLSTIDGQRRLFSVEGGEISQL